MLAPFKAFKKPALLEREVHQGLRVLKPLDYSFMKEVEIVPLTFSELLSVSMYYPVMFGVFRKEIFPFAVLGINGKNVYLREDGFFKVEVIPRVVLCYPFGVVKREENEAEEWMVVVDEECLTPDKGELLFEEEGEESSFLSSVKAELTDLALDFKKVYEFSKEIHDLGCLKSIDFRVSTKWGEAVFSKVLIGNIEVLSKLQPEKLYYLNITGYLPIIYSIYFSVRNFKLFDLM